MKRTKAFIPCIPIVLLLAGCSEESKSVANKAPAPPPEPVTALKAVSQMYITARAWASDAQLIQVANLDLKEVKSAEGKAGAWECTFVTQSRMRSRRYTYSVIAVPASNLQKGAFAGSEDMWSPGGKNRPFFIQALKTDSTAAYATAMKKGAEYAGKHTNMPINFVLEATKQWSDPAWRVIWGESAAVSDYSIYVNATTGDFLKIAR